MPTTNYIDMILEMKKNFFMGDQSGIYLLACSVACICAFFFLIGWYNHMMNDPWGMFDLKAIVRVVAIIAMVCNFHTLVLAPLDSISGLVTKGITASVKADPQSVQSKMSSAYSAVENALSNNTLRGQFEQMLDGSAASTSVDALAYDSSPVLESQAESTAESGSEKGFFARVWGYIRGAAQDALGFPFKGISTVLSWLISCIVDLVRLCLMMISGVMLIVLGLLGPFVFALSIVPHFQGGIASWIARYIQISFWVPVCTLVDYVNIHLKDSLLDAFAANNLIEQMIFPTTFIIALDVVTIALLLEVPTIASWVIESNGASGAGSKMVSVAKKAAKVLAKK